MEEFGAIWHQESMDDMNFKLQYATLELESIKIKANEQMMKHREDIKQLLNLLQIAYNERDEAREQLQKLLNKLIPSNPEFPVLVPTKANSSITESNSLSENHNYYSHNSSPEFSSLNQDFPQIPTQSDPAIDIIDAIASGKPLPENGKFLQAVVEAGPLLQTLLVAGPLPRWRNPPLLHQLGLSRIASPALAPGYLPRKRGRVPCRSTGQVDQNCPCPAPKPGQGRGD